MCIYCASQIFGTTGRFVPVQAHRGVVPINSVFEHHASANLLPEYSLVSAWKVDVNTMFEVREDQTEQLGRYLDS